MIRCEVAVLFTSEMEGRSATHLAIESVALLTFESGFVTIDVLAQLVSCHGERNLRDECIVTLDGNTIACILTHCRAEQARYLASDLEGLALEVCRAIHGKTVLAVVSRR